MLLGIDCLPFAKAFSTGLRINSCNGLLQVLRNIAFEIVIMSMIGFVEWYHL